MNYTYQVFQANGKGEECGYNFDWDTITEARNAAPKLSDIPNGDALILIKTSCKTGKWWVVDVKGSAKAASKCWVVKEAEKKGGR